MSNPRPSPSFMRPGLGFLCRISSHGRPQKFFQGEESRHFAYLFQFVGDATQMDVHKKLSNFTATVTYSVFPIRKFYTEKIFVLVRMDILRVS